MSKPGKRLEFGDYQTPPGLAKRCCQLLRENRIEPRSVLEPTCGVGAFLFACADEFSGLNHLSGLEINAQYVETAQRIAAERPSRTPIEVAQASFFTGQWRDSIAKLTEPLLVIGNPPWVTNSSLSTVGSGNLPAKSNFKEQSGLDAVTGKSNFDISEYMLIKLAEELQGRRAWLAMLCKTTVARKIMVYCWKRGLELEDCQMYPVDAGRFFGAAVDACFFVAAFGGVNARRQCVVHSGLHQHPVKTLGYRDGMVISKLDEYERWRHFTGESRFTWRSGIKHDCAKVMEFTEIDGRLVNGYGEVPELERDYLYPLLKSSTLAGAARAEKRWVLITQREVGQNTAELEVKAPRVWEYLRAHSEQLARRASSIYRGRPRFSIFGVGSYSFAPWKIGISGLYKRLQFRLISPQEGRPVMLDDTGYFLPCGSENEARQIMTVLESAQVGEFYNSLIHWDSKRPITVEILSRLCIEKAASWLGYPLEADGDKREDRQGRLFA